MLTPESSPPDARPAALPAAWIERVFATMRATYGATFDRQWAPPPGLSDDQLREHGQQQMALWARQLVGLIGAPYRISFALENLPEYPPNLVQFKALCWHAPERAAPVPALPAPVQDRARVAAALARMRDLQLHHSPIQWAHDLRDREAAEDADTPASKRMTQVQRDAWREALASKAADPIGEGVTFNPIPLGALPPAMRAEAMRRLDPRLADREYESMPPGELL